MNITEKYYWITSHPKYVPFGDDAVIEITPHMVCPETNCIEKPELLNTKMQFWVELLIPYFDEQFQMHTHMHDYELDCGGDTWEEAVENLYQLVLKKYGDYSPADLEKHQNEAIGNFDVDTWFNTIETLSVTKSNDNNDEVVMLLDFELDRYALELEHLEKRLLSLLTKLNDTSISMNDYSDIELQIICVDHDILVAKECIRLGYDVEIYGVRNDT